MWQQWVNLVVGLWIILSGYLSFTPETTTTNLTIAGIVIVGMAIWGIADYRSRTGEHSRI